MEIWRDIKGYEGLYQVSNYGRVKSLNYNHTKKEGIMKAALDGGGYLHLRLHKNGKRKNFFVHRLVADAFLPNPDNFPIVNHKNEKPSDNRVENLEWCDVKYNNNYGTRNERISKTQINGKKSKPVLQFTLDGTFVREWPSTHEAGRNGFKQAHVSACCRGNTRLKTYKGFIWKYKEVA